MITSFLISNSKEKVQTQKKTSQTQQILSSRKNITNNNCSHEYLKTWKYLMTDSN
jgi:hypothetical protein